MSAQVYLDCAATTPTRPEVVEAMTNAMTETWGNASSAHATGQQARRIVDEARLRVATLVGARPDEIVFTGGATESNNAAILGSLEAHKGKGKRLVTTTIEHPSVMEAARYAATLGWAVAYAKADAQGVVPPGAVAGLLTEKTALVSVMLANNEVGTIQPVGEIARAAKTAGAFTHTDATQAVGKIPVDVNALHVDFLSLSAHKFGGPKGIGALYVRRGVKLIPLLHGGEQEHGRRSGTLNVPGIAGLGVAAELAGKEMTATAAKVKLLRDRLEAGILEKIPHTRLNGHPTDRLPGHLNCSFEFVEGESMMMSLDLAGIAVSTGSACSSGSLEPSHVLTAMGCDGARAHASLRFSLGIHNTDADVDAVLAKLPPIVERLRKMSPTFADFTKRNTAHVGA